MPVRELPISADQSRATQRHNLEGVVYCLSGTLPGRRAGVADAPFRWATLTFSGAYGDFEAYLSPPQQILRAQGFLPGEGSETAAVRIPLFNRRFGEGESLLGVIDDGVYAWEEAEATLRVGYLKPGQTAADLAAGDWTTLIEDGFLGAPENITLEGFVVPLFSRGAQRNRAFKQPRTPGTAELISGNVDKKDLGSVMPVVIGKPSTWYAPPTAEIGLRGFTTSAFSAGDQDIEVRLISDGNWDGSITSPPVFGGAGQTLFGHTISGGPVFWIHRQNPIYITSGGANSFDRTSGILKLRLASGLLDDVPRGAFVQEHVRYRPNTGGHGTEFHWVAAAHPMLNWTGDAFASQPDMEGNVGFLFADGTIRVADPTVWRFAVDENAGAGDEFLTVFDAEAFDNTTVLRRQRGLDVLRDADGAIDTPPPVWFDPDFGIATVTQQPTFTAVARLSSKINYPTGGTGTNNANARDGSTDTAASLGVSSVITLTFNSIGGSTFVDGDTIYSVLHVVTQGDIDFTDAAGSITFGQANGTGGTNREFRFVQGTARDYNATVRCVGAGGSGGSVVEVWWEHDLEATETSTRTADVELSSGPGGAVSGITLGAPLVYSQVVMRVPSTMNGVQGTSYANRTNSFASVNAFRDQDVEDTFSNYATTSGSSLLPAKAYPTAAMTAIQSIFLGARYGSFLDVNSGVYRTAHARYEALDYRWGFVLDTEISSWTDLEADLARQARAHFYYGPQGHEIVVIEDAVTFQQSGAAQEFRLPGAPGADCGRPRISRIRADEIINSIRVLYDNDLVEGGGLRRSEEANNAASQAIYGTRRDARGGDLRFWAWSEWDAHPSFDAGAAVSGIAQVFADRGAFATTRFEFDTAWIAHGVERGSPVRMVYAVASGVYRNVIAEVERISVSPSDGERFTIQARAVTTPTEGLPIFTWEELFTESGDLWVSKITTESAIWSDKWSI